MSQNDYVIANATAPAFRADLNLALQALASLSSGTAPPSTTYANMLWYETDTNLLKMRSEANDAWITLGTLDQSSNTFLPSLVSPGLTGTPTAPTAALGTDTTQIATTAFVDNATIGLAFDGIGSTCLMKVSGVVAAPGGILGQIRLEYSDASGTSTSNTVPSGSTWMCVGNVTAGQVSLFRRVT